MFDPTRDFDVMLREGLRAVPVPDASTDFDAKVMQAVATRVPWWSALLGQARPILSGAVCSLAATLVLLQWSISSPSVHSTNQTEASGAVIALDQVLDKGEVRAGSLTQFTRLVTVVSPVRIEATPLQKTVKPAPSGRRTQSSAPRVV